MQNDANICQMYSQNGSCTASPERMLPGVLFSKVAYPLTPSRVNNNVLKESPYKEAFFIVWFSAGGAFSV